ncbi:MAG: DUF1015 family protein [Actinomycetota bacterium]
MPNLRPFHGIRYTSASELRDLVCPPYDVISSEEQEQLRARHPHNAVRLELGTGKGSLQERYAGVAETFSAWLNEDVLARDRAPCFYAYRQDFVSQSGSRCRVAGVMGALELEPFGAASGVLPHERTMPAPIEDRLALLEACPVNISPIYAIYRGGGELAPFLESLGSRSPEARFEDDAGVAHRLWAVSDAAEIEAVVAAVRPRPLVIADGHHRYETALAYHERHSKEPGEHDAIMCFCVDADAEDLVVLPYHRTLKTSRSPASIKRQLSSDFSTTPIDSASKVPVRLARSKADHAFAFAFGDENVLVEMTAAEVEESVGGRAPAWSGLDVVALHEALIPRLFPEGVGEIQFSKDADEITRLVRKEGFTVGVLLRAVEAVDVVEVARSNERMPQKASYFWPKAASGLVFRSLR